jgi:Asp-tRNA(Asn)/Glu-tRNA(Gln) amidotransferase C subunit
LYLSCFDSDQIKQWQSYIKKAMIFYEWFENLKEFIERDEDKLTEQVSFKLSEIVQFVEQYGQIEKEEIEFVDLATA